jgi:hypothetical protein
MATEKPVNEVLLSSSVLSSSVLIRMQRVVHPLVDQIWRLLNLEIWQRIFIDGEKPHVGS